nr:four helix bundle protein [uncultured Bacteroides sp.]
MKNKSINFAIRIVNLYNFLNEIKQERIMSKQILRSDTSVRTNIREGLFAESPADFIHKYSIAQKERSETLYRFELLNKTDHITTEQNVSLDTDCTELMKMLTSSIIPRKKNLCPLITNP